MPGFRNADFLSSIEVLILEQMNALSMQNWEHLQVSHHLLIHFLFLIATVRLIWVQ